MSALDRFRITWLDRGREPQCEPDPRFPSGRDVGLSATQAANVKTCQTPLPYPAKRCGYWSIYCNVCRTLNLVTAAGRPDDPRSVRLPCGRTLQ